VGEAADGDAGCVVAARFNPEVILMDVRDVRTMGMGLRRRGEDRFRGKRTGAAAGGGLGGRGSRPGAGSPRV